MAELKTKATTESVEKFLNGIADETRRQDCFRVLKIMKAATKTEPVMWGTSVVGFGSYRYKYKTGREGDWFLAGFSPRKDRLTLYLMSGLKRHGALLEKLGKHKTGGGCLYIKKLEDIHLPTLKQLIKQSIADIKQMDRK